MNILLIVSPIQTTFCFLQRLNLVKFVNIPISVGTEPTNLFLPTSLSDRWQKDQGNTVTLKQDRI